MWILPTMSRPEQCEDVLRRIEASGSVSDGAVVVNGESHIDKYLNIRLPTGWRLMGTKENLGVIGALNWLFNRYSTEDWYGVIFDDEFLISGNPDDIYVAAGLRNLAHGWDNWNDGGRFHGYCVIGGDLARAVGCLALPDCWHHFGFDCMWEWLSSPYIVGGRVCKNRLVESVRVEHRHHKLGLSAKDDCYTLADNSFEKDREAFYTWQQKNMIKKIKLIKRELMI